MVPIAGIVLARPLPLTLPPWSRVCFLRSHQRWSPIPRLKNYPSHRVISGSKHIASLSSEKKLFSPSSSAPVQGAVPAQTADRATVCISPEQQLVHFSQLGAGVETRLDELHQHKLAPTYPRVAQSSANLPVLRISDFIEQYRNGSDLKNDASSRPMTLRGRVMTVRRSGSKLAFIDIVDDSSTIQVMINFKTTLSSSSPSSSPPSPSQTDDAAEIHLQRFKTLLRVLRRGDFISVAGVPGKTSSGELSLFATDLPEIIAPAVSALPETLNNDHRMVHRHVNLLIDSKARDTLRLRSHLLTHLRGVFAQEGFIEVATPVLAATATGAVAEPFVTRDLPADDTVDETAGTAGTACSSGRCHALRIAPELWLKRLVVGGLERVYELGPAFRNEGQDTRHNPEFTVCEFYRAYASLSDLLAWTENMLQGLALSLVARFAVEAPMPCRIVAAAFGGVDGGNDGVDSSLPYPIVEFLPALEKALDLRFAELDLDKYGGLERLVAAISSRGCLDDEVIQRAVTDGSMSKIFDALSARHLERLHPGRPFFLVHQPAFMSPLSKWFVCPTTGLAVAARAELFYNGLELANMYEEENSPFEQRRKFLARLGGLEDRAAWAWQPGMSSDVHVDARLAWAAQPERGDDPRAASSPAQDRDDEFIDEQYIETLLTGMPPTGGWGCGIDRLVMLFSGQQSISDVLTFGSLRHVRAVSERSRYLHETGQKLLRARFLSSTK